MFSCIVLETGERRDAVYKTGCFLDLFLGHGGSKGLVVGEEAVFIVGVDDGSRGGVGRGRHDVNGLGRGRNGVGFEL